MQSKIDKISIALLSITGAVGVFLILNIWLSSNVLIAYGFFDKRRVIELVMLGIGLLVILTNPKRTHKMAALTRSWPFWIQLLVGVFFLAGLIHAALSANPRFAFLNVALVMGLLLCAILVATIKQDHPKWTRELLTSTIITSLGIYCIIDILVIFEFSLGQGHHLLTQNDFIKLIFSPFYTSPRFFAQVLSLLLPFVVLPLMKPRSDWFSRSMAWCFATYVWILALGQQSQGLYLALIISFIFAAIVFRKQAWRFIAKQLICFVIAAIISFVIAKFLLGIPFKGLENAIGTWHLSTAVLLFVSKWGVIPAIIALVLLICALFKQTRNTLAHPEPTQLALTLSLIGFIVTSAIDGSFMYPAPQIIMLILAGWMIGNITQKKALKRSLFNKITQVKFHVLALLVIGLISWGVFPQVFQLPQIKQNFRNEHPAIKPEPHFWEVGKYAQ